MKTKIYVGRDLIGRFTCDGRKYTKFQVQMFYAKRAFKRTMTVAAIIVSLGWVWAGSMAYTVANIKPEVAWAKEVVEVPIQVMPPLLEHIADCESGRRDASNRAYKGSASHYDTKRQMVLIRGNSDSVRSVDIGYLQINDYYHGAAAKALGYDLMDEDDNKAYGVYLYNTQATYPWTASESCWKQGYAK
jgi:hypothetical protein